VGQLSPPMFSNALQISVPPPLLVTALRNLEAVKLSLSRIRAHIRLLPARSAHRDALVIVTLTVTTPVNR